MGEKVLDTALRDSRFVLSARTSRCCNSLLLESSARNWGPSIASPGSFRTDLLLAANKTYSHQKPQNRPCTGLVSAGIVFFYSVEGPSRRSGVR